jgi:hypothetical protein
LRTKVSWNKQIEECTTVSNNDLVFYPCLKFFDSRLKVLEKEGMGFSIWEAGQGLDYFFELF